MFKKMMVVVLTLSAIPAVANMLKPCIEGGLSATGNYSNQAMEDLVLASRPQQLHSNETRELAVSNEVAFPDDDEETYWVAPEWRDHRS